MKGVDLWTEHLFEKHECMSYGSSDTARRTIEIDGLAVTLVVPEWLPEIEPVTSAAQGDLLFVLGKIREQKERGIAESGAILIGRRMHDSSYRVHVWHETYLHALGHLIPQTGGSQP